MMSIFLPLGLGLIVTLAFRIYQNRMIEKIPLKPNCLLTRYPLLFIELKKSPWYFSHKSKISRHLFAHGYETIDIKGRDSVEKLLKEITTVQKIHQRAHIFYDPRLENSIQKLKRKNEDFFASLHPLSEKANKDYLETAISLAESDFQCSH